MNVDTIAEQNIACPRCGAEERAEAYFCSYCGAALREKPPSTTLGAQLKVYLIALLVPPFGLWYGWKYGKWDDQKSRWIALTASLLTLLSLWATWWVIQSLMSSLTTTLNAMVGI
ncbi:MAG: zinc ribbon domain-containing protein [Patescibacteria group bacterium]|nr:zinc ribbon domain-containing protein [Patescibacteria group bacterium]MDE2438614.1 zinc ribbon domain-containing protein [Patescibacteria group bacterium]